MSGWGRAVCNAPARERSSSPKLSPLFLFSPLFATLLKREITSGFSQLVLYQRRFTVPLPGESASPLGWSFTHQQRREGAAGKRNTLGLPNGSCRGTWCKSGCSTAAPEPGRGWGASQHPTALPGARTRPRPAVPSP